MSWPRRPTNMRPTILALLMLVAGCASPGATPTPTATGERIAPPPADDLVDTSWVLETLFVGDVASAALGEPATLELSSGGTFSGSTGCRTFTGTWIEEGEQILATTMSMGEGECPAELAEQDGHVVSVVGDGFVPTIEESLLTLTDPGSIGLVYRPDD